MAKPIAPLPVVQRSIAARVLLEIEKVDNDDIGLYLGQQLAAIVRENPIVASVLALLKKKAQEAKGKEAGLTALQAGITVYETLRSQTMFNYRQFFLKAQQAERSKENKKAKYL